MLDVFVALPFEIRRQVVREVRSDSDPGRGFAQLLGSDVELFGRREGSAEREQGVFGVCGYQEDEGMGLPCRFWCWGQSSDAGVGKVSQQDHELGCQLAHLGDPAEEPHDVGVAACLIWRGQDVCGIELLEGFCDCPLIARAGRSAFGLVRAIFLSSERVVEIGEAIPFAAGEFLPRGFLERRHMHLDERSRAPAVCVKARDGNHADAVAFGDAG